MATVRADPDAGVEVVALGQEIFGGLMAESQASREALDQVARARMAENSNGRNGAKDA
jgi:hypothetical protein